MHKYNLIQRFFHDLVFKKKINKSLFEIEKNLFKK